jgi:hypothetical protein
MYILIYTPKSNRECIIIIYIYILLYYVFFFSCFVTRILINAITEVAIRSVKSTKINDHCPRVSLWSSECHVLSFFYFFFLRNLWANVHSLRRTTRNIFAMETSKRLSRDNFLPGVDCWPTRTRIPFAVSLGEILYSARMARKHYRGFRDKSRFSRFSTFYFPLPT